MWNVKKDTSLGASADEIGINRNIVECKETRYFVSETFDSTGINRNIVECKGWWWTAYPWHRYSINRNIVECKVSYATPQQIGASAY